MNSIEELQEKLDKLYIVKESVKSYVHMGSNFMKVIILTDTSKINKDVLTIPLQMMYDLLYQHGIHSAHFVLNYNGIGIKFLDIYNHHKKFKLKHWGSDPPFYRGVGVNLGGYDSDPLTTIKCERLGININTIEDKGIILRYVEIKDVEEAIFNTRMAIYNLTHRNEDIERLYKEIEMLKGKSKSKGHEECCDKLESRLDRLKINLSRVEGMVREIEVPRNTTLRVSPNRPRYYFSAPYLNSPIQSSSRPNSQTRRKPIPKHLFYSRPQMPEFP
jgi:hypothetical protein